MSTALRSVGLLDILSSMPAEPSVALAGTRQMRLVSMPVCAASLRTFMNNAGWGIRLADSIQPLALGTGLKDTKTFSLVSLTNLLGTFQGNRENMKKAFCFAALLGMALATPPRPSPAQAIRPNEASATATAVVPVDHQATKEQLTKLFKLMRLQDQIASLTNGLEAVMQQEMTERMKQLRQNNPEFASEQQALTKIINKYMERVKTLYPFNEMIEDITNVYQKYVTRSDVDGIIAFYSSSAGQHWLDVQPVILQEFLPLAMQRQQDRVKALMEDLKKEMMESSKSKTPVGK
jgi:hypothetical protein